MKLGERLRLMRKENKLTLKDLSQIAELSVPYLSDMERGVVNPSFDTLQKVAKAYNTTVKKLLIDVEELDELEDTNYPEGFEAFIKDPEYTYEINSDWKELLMNINFRGKQPSTKREWIEVYLSLRRILSSEEDKE